MSTAENPTRPVLTDAEVKALARLLVVKLTADWRDHLSWEDVPLLSAQEWGRLTDALDKLAAEGIKAAHACDEADGIDSIYLWEQTQ